MRLSDIDYDLPEELIAQHPVEPRDSARLLDATTLGTSGLAHRRVSDLVDLVREGDLLVVNETRVIPARLRLRLRLRLRAWPSAASGLLAQRDDPALERALARRVLARQVASKSLTPTCRCRKR